MRMEFSGEMWDGGCVVPVKDVVRNAESIEVGDVVTVRLTVDV